MILVHPKVDSLHDKIGFILDDLRQLNVAQEGIALPCAPTIVIVGDRSSGKSSLLESVTGISLPRGEETITRVPLVMKFQHHPHDVMEFLLQYQEKNIKIADETQVRDAVDKATLEIAGEGKGISNVPITLIVKKKNAPDFIMVDLPGVPVHVHGQPTDIYKQISDMVMEYIKPEETVILNVMSASADFQTCDSLRMSREVDVTGMRTLAVVTKCDIQPQGLLEKIKRNDVHTGLGCVCVRNHMDDETESEATKQEALLFDTNPFLSEIDKSMVGIPVLTTRLVDIQDQMTARCFPPIMTKIADRLDELESDLDKFPQKPAVATTQDATILLHRIIGPVKDTLINIFIRGEYGAKYIQQRQMHSDARLSEMLNTFSNELRSKVRFGEKFLAEEITTLKEDSDGIRLPQYVGRSAFLFLLQKRLNSISQLPVNFINKVWAHLETICTIVVTDHCSNYPLLLPSFKTAADKVLGKTKNKLKEKLKEMIEMEEITSFTSDPNFITSVNKLMGSHDHFLNAIKSRKSCIRGSWPMTAGFGLFDVMSRADKASLEINVEGYGAVNIEHLVDVEESLRDQAFDLKMRITAYWEIVSNRMVDWMALQLRFVVRQMVNTDLEAEIVNEVTVNGGGIQKVLAEPPSVEENRERLHQAA